jgi:hypothetical protein
VGRACGTYGRGEKRVQGFGGKARRKKNTWKPRLRWQDGVKIDLRQIGWGVRSGFTWLRIGTVGGLLWMRWWTFGFWRHGVSYTNQVPDPLKEFLALLTLHFFTDTSLQHDANLTPWKATAMIIRTHRVSLRFCCICFCCIVWIKKGRNICCTWERTCSFHLACPYKMNVLLNHIIYSRSAS